MLQDAIINAYWPGHIIQKAISHPANLCVCHQDLETFIRELFERGVPQEALFQLLRAGNFICKNSLLATKPMFWQPIYGMQFWETCSFWLSLCLQHWPHVSPTSIMSPVV
ncbi:hypothetical protein DAPPUDRAFT_272740 [Daphnia pulex]|uniref:Uncharacterized protein n=1 Tax=Daphnia pulex TaxID=6669 RepID=E9I360_DAPPU|nr:hypothetical protein DAPPUDRAFT_272740 [Daphnia pulex]|eukprot:EFX61570.1 hypothetical protein DAPPUDRAFT_272740 [Daphnia pulex]